MLEQNELHVLLGELGLLQGAHEEDVRIGAAGHGDALALQVLDLGDAGVLAGHERRPFGAGIDVDRLDRVAVDLADQGGGAGGGAEIDRARIEEFERLVGAERLYPADLDAVLFELLLQEALVLQDEADRVVGGVIDADFLHLRRGGGGEGGKAGGERSGDEEAAGQAHCFVPCLAHGSIVRGARRFSCTCFAPAICMLKSARVRFIEPCVFYVKLYLL